MLGCCVNVLSWCVKITPSRGGCVALPCLKILGVSRYSVDTGVVRQDTILKYVYARMLVGVSSSWALWIADAAASWVCFSGSIPLDISFWWFRLFENISCVWIFTRIFVICIVKKWLWYCAVKWIWYCAVASLFALVDRFRWFFSKTLFTNKYYSQIFNKKISTRNFQQKNCE